MERNKITDSVKKAILSVLISILISGCATYEYIEYASSARKDTASLTNDLKSKNWLIRHHAVIALGEGGEEAINPLINASFDPTPKVRERAFQSLAMVYSRTKDRRAADRIIEAGKNNDKSLSVRVVLITSLFQIREASPFEVINVIIEYLADEEVLSFSDYSPGKMAEKFLLAMGAEPVPCLIFSLDNASPATKVRVISVLAKIRDLKAVEPLIAILRDNNLTLRNAAAEALGDLEDKRATESLLALSGNKQSAVVAITSLGKIKDERAVESFISFLENKDANIRNAAAEALGRIKDRRAVEPLIALLKDKNSDVAAIRALGSIKDIRAVEYIIPFLNKKNEVSVVSSAAWALGEIKDPRAAKPLVDILSDERVLIATFSSFSDPGNKKLVLWDSIPENVDEALIKIGEPAISFLTEAKNAKNPGIRKRAAYLLSKIQFPSVVKKGSLPKEVSREKIIRDIKEFRVLKGHEAPVYSLAFSPDGSYLASGSHDNTIKVWDTDGFKEIKTLTGHKREICDLAFSPDGAYLASSSYDRTVKIWKTGTFEDLKTLGDYGDWVFSIAFSPDGKYLVTACLDNTIKIWEVNNFTLLKTLKGDNKSVFSLTFSADGKYLAAVTGDKEHNIIKIWNTDNFKEVKDIGEENSLMSGLAFSPNGKYLASHGRDNTIKFWSAADFKEVKTLDTGNYVYSFVFSSSGRYLATTGSDRSINIWDTNNFEIAKTLASKNVFSSPPVMFLVFSPDDKFLAGGAIDNTIRIWQLYE